MKKKVISDSAVTPLPLHHQGPIESIIHFTNVSNTGRRVRPAGELPGMKKEKHLLLLFTRSAYQTSVANCSILEISAL